MRAISAFCILQSNSALYDLSAAVELNVVGSYVAAAIRIFFARMMLSLTKQHQL